MSFLHHTSIPKSLYLHYPLCQHVCSYCDFNVYRHTNSSTFDQDWCHSLFRHLQQWLPPEAPPPLTSLYLGGGTPSLLGVESFEALMHGLRKAFDWTAIKEVSIEANPESCERQKLKLWRKAGVNRVSLGVQSFHSHILRRLERLATRPHIDDAIAMIRESGFSLNIDLMIGLPDQSWRDFEKDLEQALQIRPEHLSIYILTLDETHPWKRSAFMQKRWVSDDGVEKMYQRLCQELKRQGFEHYEISNFAQPGHRSLHNQNYWNPDSSYLGLGPGAHGYVEHEGERLRYENLRAPEAWRKSPTGVGSKESLSQEQQRMESLYLKFRTRQWVDTEEFGQPELIEKMCEEGILEAAGGRVRLTEPRWILIDAVMSRLLRGVD